MVRGERETRERGETRKKDCYLRPLACIAFWTLVVKGIHVNGSTSSPTGERENTKHASPFPCPLSPATVYTQVLKSNLKHGFVALALKISGINRVSSCPKFRYLWVWKRWNPCGIYLCVHGSLSPEGAPLPLFLTYARSLLSTLSASSPSSPNESIATSQTTDTGKDLHIR